MVKPFMLRGLEFRDVLMKTSSIGQENKQRLKKEIFDQHFYSEDPNQETIDNNWNFLDDALNQRFI